MIKSFRDRYLEQFYLEGRRSRLIPGTLERQLARKLDMLAAAQQERDLHHPKGNYYKRLSGPFQGWSSLRVNMHWRLMFQWRHDAAEKIYLDPHQDT
ncbi:type II toxin-antitoxin system RelE/ParE family toxin [Serratia ureilytica]|uniref:type II toxin-antitoxin system RelE/ParE family toxin n=1 Tax=Serratia ureilytica TaxID=300181 RepID=UPI0019CFA60F|nr:type II toxin-antitoxin system RelE/ParE family toxin [Serratia ureilytica]MBN5215048.1 type II toxin-antitoxin system RelE/ParE family toxin [Serratia ureilytica]